MCIRRCRSLETYLLCERLRQGVPRANNPACTLQRVFFPIVGLVFVPRATHAYHTQAGGSAAILVERRGKPRAWALGDGDVVISVRPPACCDALRMQLTKQAVDVTVRAR